MRNLKYLFLAVVAAMTIYACQTSGSANAEAKDEGNSGAIATTPSNANQPAATNPATPKKPDFQAKAEGMAKTTVNFVSEDYNYGKVPTGTKVTHQFKFTNTGSEPLTLTRVKASCGCTTPSYSQEPIAPGAEGYIDVLFNTAGKTGVQNKTVTVTGNFEGSINKILRISGEVLPGENQ
ncbi:MAG: DUF1573 domain-containing protein [Bacteroidetes bacterium]|nr:DUF1573 domain-containing protein [Bacteroidota bacterium]MCB0841890.1 DUF1573 domain-containing protein [Bacteroidota bacterium]